MAKKHPAAKKPAKGKGAKKSPLWKHGKRLITLKKPPPSFVDVGLNQQVAASRRGLQDLVAELDPKTGTQTTRAVDDLLLGITDLNRRQTQAEQDYQTGVAAENTGYQQTLADLLTQRQAVQRNYQQLAGQQSQAFRASGLAGGAAAQAAAKRAANQALDVAPIDTAQTRSTQQHKLSLDDMLRQHQRMFDPKTGTFKLEAGQLGRDFTRGTQDRATQLSTARREANQFAKDVAQQQMTNYLRAGNPRTMRVKKKVYKKYKKLGVI